MDEQDETEIDEQLFNPQYIILDYDHGSIIARKLKQDEKVDAHLFTADEILVRVEQALRKGHAVALGALL